MRCQCMCIITIISFFHNKTKKQEQVFLHGYIYVYLYSLCLISSPYKNRKCFIIFLTTRNVFFLERHPWKNNFGRIIQLSFFLLENNIIRCYFGCICNLYLRVFQYLPNFITKKIKDVLNPLTPHITVSLYCGIMAI